MSSQAIQRKSRAIASSLSNPASISAESSQSLASTPASSLSFVGRLHRLVDRDVEWDKAELLDTIYWLRQALAVLCGPLFGLLGVTGSAGMIVFVAVLMVGVFGWYGKYQQVDVEEMGSWQLMSEGSWPAFALFVVRSSAHNTQQTQHWTQLTLARSIHGLYGATVR